jgi:hypothetical protein
MRVKRLGDRLIISIDKIDQYFIIICILAAIGWLTL